MTDIDPNHRAQIEAWLGRPLTDSELQPVESLDALTDEQFAVVAAIRPRHLIAPLLYLRAITRATIPEIRDVLDNFERMLAARYPKGLANLALFEHHTGRALSSAEMLPSRTLEELSPAHLAIAATLARKELTAAFLYLQSIVPSAAVDACNALAKQLAKLAG